MKLFTDYELHHYPIGQLLKVTSRLRIPIGHSPNKLFTVKVIKCPKASEVGVAVTSIKKSDYLDQTLNNPLNCHWTKSHSAGVARDAVKRHVETSPLTQKVRQCCRRGRRCLSLWRFASLEAQENFFGVIKSISTKLLCQGVKNEIQVKVNSG